MYAFLSKAHLRVTSARSLASSLHPLYLLLVCNSIIILVLSFLHEQVQRLYQASHAQSISALFSNRSCGEHPPLLSTAEELVAIVIASYLVNNLGFQLWL